MRYGALSTLGTQLLQMWITKFEESDNRIQFLRDWGVGIETKLGETDD